MRKTPFTTPLTDEDLHALGLSAFGFIETKDIQFSEEVRHICRNNACGKYGKTWACPPGVGTYDECREKILQYPSAFVFSGIYTLEDSFDFEGMIEGHRQFKLACRQLHEHLEKPFLLLSNEGCSNCKVCTYPDAPCRFPDKLFPSVEGFGILVNKLAASAGMKYINGVNTVTYFGMVCFG